MSIAIITGSAGLVGSESARFFHEQGLDVVGIDNDMRAYFFGSEASVAWNARRLQAELSRYTHLSIDIRDEAAVGQVFERHGADISVVIHCASQPSHDWAAREPITDFTVNANGTLVLLEALRRHAPRAAFLFASTNKVYGDTPNSLPLRELERRWEIDESHPYHDHGIDETMSIDRSMHSVFGASKVAADVMVQEYGRYFGLNTVAFRGGCLTGPAHSGAQLHGFLAYLVRCAVERRPYTIFGYKGKQVRDNIHSHDLVRAFWHYFRDPRPGAVFNIGGSRHSNCSVLEAIDLVQELGGEELRYTVSDQARSGDHIWWVSDVRAFGAAYPAWRFEYDLRETTREIVEAVRERRKT